MAFCEKKRNDGDCDNCGCFDCLDEILRECRKKNRQDPCESGGCDKNYLRINFRD